MPLPEALTNRVTLRVVDPGYAITAPGAVRLVAGEGEQLKALIDGMMVDALRAVAAQGYTQPTPIQLQAIPAVLARGLDRGDDVLAGRLGHQPPEDVVAEPQL